jgi:hypothetical protein
MHLLFKVVWIEHCTYLVHECLGRFVICCSSSMSIMSFLMHPWYSSCAYACNRYTGRSDPVGVRGTVPGGIAATNTKGSGGAACRRSVGWGHRWLSRPRPMQFRERQALKHYMSPNFWNVIKYYVIYVVALSHWCWMKILAVMISNPCPEIIPWILCSSGSSRCLALL